MVCTCYPHFALITFSCYGIFHKRVLDIGRVFSDEFVDDPFLSENFIRAGPALWKLLSYQLGYLGN